MKEGQLLVILSEGLRTIIENLKTKHDSEIAKELLRADDLTNAYNELLPYYHYPEEENRSPKDRATILAQELIANELANIITEEVRMLGFRDNSFEISYLPKGKEAVYSDIDRGIWSRKNRQTGKPGRIVQKLLKRKFTTKDFENFSNQIKAEFDCAGTFRIVEGEDITKYYNKDTYYKKNATLGNSCMRYDECKDYFGCYEEAAKMLCYFRDDKLMGRAIIWEIDGNTYMDRVYVCSDYLESSFYEYAELHKWIVREDNSILHDGDEIRWRGPEDNYASPFIKHLKIQLSQDYDYMPYVDTFRYYDDVNHILYTDPEASDCCLSNTDGSFDHRIRIVCENCGGEEYCYEDEGPSEMYWSEYYDCYYCDDCALWCEYLQTYINIHGDNVNVYTDQDIWDVLPLSYVVGNSAFVKFNDDYYHIDSDKVVFDDDTEEYKLKDE